MKIVRRPVTVTEEVKAKYLIDLRVSQVFQLRLHHLFGYDPTTWEEAVAVKEVDEVDVPSGGP